MKFGKRLETESLERFRSFYIQYKELKKALKVFTGQERDQATVQEVTHWTSSFLRLGPNPEVPPEARLNDILESELKRISKFTALQEEGLRSQLERLEEAAAEAAAANGGGEDQRSALRQKLEELGNQLVELKSFVQLNFTGFRKILKKYDKWSKSAVLTWFMGQVMRAPLMSVKFESHLLKLNGIAMSVAGSPAGSAPQLPASAPSGAGGATVLLVQNKATMWVKVQLALHLRLAPADPAAGAAAAPGAAAVASPLRPRRSSYYFDTPDFSVYDAYVGAGNGPPPTPPCGLLHLRDEGADEVRLVRAPMGGPAAVEVPLTRAEASQLVKGEYIATPASAASALGAGSVTAEAVLGEFRAAAAQGLRAMALASARRSAFTAEDSPFVAAVEEDIQLARAQEWGGPPGPMEYLPCNVVEIASAPQDPPKWLSAIYDSPDVMQVSDFSLALHAIARCCAKSPRPYWYASLLDTFAFAEDEEKPSEMGSDESRLKPTPPGQSLLKSVDEQGGHEGGAPLWKSGAGARMLHEFGPDQTEPRSLHQSEELPGPDADLEPAAEGGLAAPLLARPAAAGSAEQRGLFASLFGQRRGGPQPVPAGDLPVRRAIVTVQPKTLYSNERTFLEWMHFATIFATLGLGLMHGSPKPTNVVIGRFLVAVSVLSVLWALNTFNWRSDALDGKVIRSYHDPVGPPLLILCMLAALVLSSLAAVEVL